MRKETCIQTWLSYRAMNASDAADDQHGLFCLFLFSCRPRNSAAISVLPRPSLASPVTFCRRADAGFVRGLVGSVLLKADGAARQ